MSEITGLFDSPTTTEATIARLQSPNAPAVLTTQPESPANIQTRPQPAPQIPIKCPKDCNKNGGAFDSLEELVTHCSERHIAQSDDWASLGRHELVLWWAAQNGHEEVVRLLLLLAGVDNLDLEATDRSKVTPLAIAVDKGHDNICRLLLEHGANIECRDEYLMTPLVIAAVWGWGVIARLLLESGADPHTQSVGEETPLIRAAWVGHKEIARLLLDKGVDPNHKSEIGKAALSYAAQQGHVDIVALLLERGADIDTRDSASRTPLWCAVRYQGGPEVIRLLLQKGADLAVTVRGRTLLSAARRRDRKTGGTEISSVLKEYGVREEKLGGGEAGG